MFPDNPDNKKVQWDITNAGSDATIIQINIAWPSANGALGWINLGPSEIWFGLQEPPSTTVLPWLGDRAIYGGTQKTLEFQFESDTGAAGQYSITVTFSNGCTVSLLSTGTTIAWDDFESGGWSGGGGWSDVWSHIGRTSVAGSLELQGGSSPLLQGYVERPLDLSGKSNVHLQFQAKANSFESGDTAKCLIYDGTWYTVRTWTDGDDDNQYHFYHINLSSYNMSSGFRIAFDADMDQNSDYFYVDDLVIIEVVP